jgi:hypothetical protein
LKVGVPGEAPPTTHAFTCQLGRWSAPTLRSGDFDVYVSVGKVDGTPVYELPLPGCDGRRRYKVGAIAFK